MHKKMILELVGFGKPLLADCALEPVWRCRCWHRCSTSASGGLGIEARYRETWSSHTWVQGGFIANIWKCLVGCADDALGPQFSHNSSFSHRLGWYGAVASADETVVQRISWPHRLPCRAFFGGRFVTDEDLFILRSLRAALGTLFPSNTRFPGRHDDDGLPSS